MESSRYNIPKQLQEINKNNGKMHKWNKNINHEVFLVMYITSPAIFLLFSEIFELMSGAIRVQIKIHKASLFWWQFLFGTSSDKQGLG